MLSRQRDTAEIASHRVNAANISGTNDTPAPGLGAATHGPQLTRSGAGPPAGRQRTQMRSPLRPASCLPCDSAVGRRSRRWHGALLLWPEASRRLRPTLAAAGMGSANGAAREATRAPLCFGFAGDPVRFCFGRTLVDRILVGAGRSSDSAQGRARPQRGPGGRAHEGAGRACAAPDAGD